MNDIEKHLNKLESRKRERVEMCMDDIRSRRIAPYHVKKLRGHRFFFRIRIEDQRITFYMDDDHIEILDVGKRNDNTYKNL